MHIHNLARGRGFILGKIVLGWRKKRLVVTKMAPRGRRTGTFFPFLKMGHKLGEGEERISTRSCSMNVRGMTEESVDEVIVIRWRIAIQSVGVCWRVGGPIKIGG